MLAGTLVYVNAGTQLAHIESLSGILSPALLGSFVLLGVFPLIAKKIAERWRMQGLRRLEQAGPLRPQSGRHRRRPAGLVTAYIAAAVKAKVTLVEKHKLGGDCLNTGCVPSKALIRSAKLLSHMRRAPEFGIRGAGRVRFRRGHGAGAARDQDHRAARFGRALHRSRRRCDRRQGEDHLALGGGSHPRRRPTQR